MMNTDSFTWLLHRRSASMISLLRSLIFAFLIAIGIACVFATEAWAQTPPPKAAPKAAAAGQGKKTTVNFEDQLVEGSTQKPELFYLLQQRNNNFKRLIKLRENFLPEMRKTSEDLSRKGNAN